MTSCSPRKVIKVILESTLFTFQSNGEEASPLNDRSGGRFQKESIPRRWELRVDSKGSKCKGWNRL